MWPGIGSPPRMRGKVDPWYFVACNVGITPAYAGKSLCFCRIVIHGKDHPRVCGEKSARFLLPFQCGGSPPRMRGKGLVRYLAD